MPELIEVDGLSADLAVEEEVVGFIESAEQGPPGPPGPASEGLPAAIVAGLVANPPSAANPVATMADTHTSGSDAETLTSIAALIQSSGAITAPADADKFGFRDSVSGLWVHITSANIKAWLKAYFDLFYVSFAALEGKLNATSGIATNLKETRQTTITTAVTSLDWSAGHIDLNYAGNTDIATTGVTNIPTDGISFLTVTLWHVGGVRSITWKTIQFESTAPTLAGTSGGFDRFVLTPSKINAGKFFIICVESK